MMKISVLGATGSIGTQTLEVVRTLQCAEISALTAYGNIDLLEKQILEFKPKIAAVMDKQKAAALQKKLSGVPTKIVGGLEGILEAATLPEVDMVVNALVGNIGLVPTVKAIEAKKHIALANKETLVTAGALVMHLAAQNNVKIYPVDSEHSAIFQCLQGNLQNKIQTIYLTASGGPFRSKTAEELKKVTLQDALRHPNWSMGKKITIDSATLMNKGLEVIEAKWLFDVDASQITVVVHPQSVVHSMVEFYDGAVMAQLGEPDMKVPIQYALCYPNRPQNSFPRINFFERNNLTFEKPKTDLFPCLGFAYEALKTGGLMPAVLNAANEVAVDLFLHGKIEFNGISLLIDKTMSAYTVKNGLSIEGILDADRWAREFTAQFAAK